ncbi:SDR family oxidoreductase [Umezawaea tangerina]|uniref:Thioester reductase-like protein n=1 Tax=Umezawaea tangerina TaxID=84725 RepID=A0A2T0SGS8_9PSEU|nr:SDR family oxidoreductase [Umezawaea tangerina]PRY32619.1 thioester reductase-like protein [Umezawaea tangerina]
MTGAHAVTGATGLVGAALVLELLARTDDEVVCLVRPGRKAGPEERLRQVLGTAAREYGAFGLEVDKRCRVVTADLAAPRLGVEGLTGVAEFWHCAADLRYEDRHWEALRDTNIGGTRHALELAEAAGATTFNYMSTAYVAGRLDGDVAEVRMDGVETNNRYEESKAAAERLVAGATAFATRTLRPSIVIGHSRTYALCGGHSGLYGIQRRLSQFKRALGALGSAEDLARPMRIRADAEARVNLVPVDLVAADAVSVSQSGAAGGIFHLTHPDPVVVGPGLGLMFEKTGLSRPVYTDDVDSFSQLDREFDRKIEFYNSYLTGRKRFDQANLVAAIGDPALRSWKFDLDELTNYLDWYHAYLRR